MGIKTFAFQIDPSADIESTWQLLEERGCELLYSEVSEQTQLILGNLPEGLKKEELLAQYPEILTVEAIELPEINWEAQWAAQGDYREGFLHVDLKDYALPSLFNNRSSSLHLIPGPGFGDLSHPTTRLALRLMGPYVQKKEVVDVGCGSGILSLAAILMGAKTVYGIDLEEEALAHSQLNSACNGMKDQIKFFLPTNYQKTCGRFVVLMNMIESEQEVAWNSFVSILDVATVVITSGILREGRGDYLKLSTKWGWKLIEELEEDGWLGFVFKTYLKEF